MGLCLGLQTEFVAQTPGKNANGEPTLKTALNLFVSVPSLLQAHPWIDTVSWFFIWA
jgi:hypothetical protein